MTAQRTGNPVPVSTPRPSVPTPRSASDDTQTSFDPVAYDRATRKAAHDHEDQPWSPFVAEMIIWGLIVLIGALVGIGAVWGPQ